MKDEGKEKRLKWQYILGDKYENNQENLKAFDNIIDDLKRLKILKTIGEMTQRWISWKEIQCELETDIENELIKLGKIKIN